MITTINEFRKYKAVNERQWGYTISIKQHISDEDFDDESQVIETCTPIVNTLRSFAKRLESGNNLELMEEIERIAANFASLISMADGTIPEADFQNYGFDGDFLNEFNEYLTDLYEIADSNSILID